MSDYSEWTPVGPGEYTSTMWSFLKGDGLRFGRGVDE